MGLLKSMPPRSTRQSDLDAIARAKNSRTVASPVRGGKSVYDRISSISTLVESKLSKYKELYGVLRDEESVRAYFKQIREYNSGALDTEASSLDPITCTIAGICLYVPRSKPVYIPLNHVSHITGAPVNNQVDISVVREELELCEQANVKWIMHNAKYDIRVIRHQVGANISCYWDTMLAARCLNENESAGLKYLHMKYCDSKDSEALTYEKLFEGIPFTQIPINVGYLYAAGDPLKTWELYEFQKQYLNRHRLPGPNYVFREIEMPCIEVLASMEDNGIRLDVEFANSLSVKYHELLEQHKQRFYDTLSMYSDKIEYYKSKNPNHKLSDPISISSPTQIAILLYDILGLKSPDKNKPRGTGEDILLALDVPLSKIILDYRETEKLLSTYIDKMPTIVNPKDGKIHCNFNQGGTVTGRISSSEPNMQNIPSKNKEIRKMFTASEGHVLISCDFSQQEPRTLAHMSGDENLIQAYKDGKDIYAWIASSIYKVPYEECKEFRPDGTKNPEGKQRRDSVKSIILGIMYSRGAKAIGEQLGISTKDAQTIVDKFFNSFPKVQKFIDETQDKARRLGYVETAWGRKRRLPEMQLPPYEFQYLEGAVPENFDPLNFDNVSSQPLEVDRATQKYYISKLNKVWSAKDKAVIKEEARQRGILIIDNGGKIADASRQCVNSVIQGTSADMTKLAMISIHNDKKLREWGCKLLLQVHDELIVEAPEENAKKVAERVSELMISAAKSKISVPMKCDAEITRVWYGDPLHFD